MGKGMIACLKTNSSMLDMVLGIWIKKFKQWTNKMQPFMLVLKGLKTPIGFKVWLSLGRWINGWTNLAQIQSPYLLKIWKS